MLGRFVSGWLGLETKCCCPDFWLFARARSWSLQRTVVFGSSLELGFSSSSESMSLVWSCSFAFLARASFSSLERVSSFFARAIVPSLERVSGFRPEGLSSSLARVLFRSSELLGCWLEQGLLGSSVDFCVWSLERPSLRSSEPVQFIYVAAGFDQSFSSSFWFQTLGPTSLSPHSPSLLGLIYF